MNLWRRVWRWLTACRHTYVVPVRAGEEIVLVCVGCYQPVRRKNLKTWT